MSGSPSRCEICLRPGRPSHAASSPSPRSVRSPGSPPERDGEDVELARQTTAAQLERIAATYRAACRNADPDPVRAALDGSFVSSAGNADGVTTTITLSGP